MSANSTEKAILDIEAAMRERYTGETGWPWPDDREFDRLLRICARAAFVHTQRSIDAALSASTLRGADRFHGTADDFDQPTQSARSEGS